MTDRDTGTGERQGWRERAAEWGQRWAARRASRARARGVPHWPELRMAGSAARGRRLLQGQLRIGEEVVERPGEVIWDLVAGRPEGVGLHGMAWLDDLAALGTGPARTLAQDWVGEWVLRFGRGTGPGWTPELAAERLLRMLGHARFLLHPRGDGEAELAQAVAAHAAFLERRWMRARAGRGRVLALVALLQARLAWPGRRATERLREALAREAGVIDAGGGIATRCPEDLLDVMGLLSAANAALVAAEIPPPAETGAALARAAPVLRSLRHADGGLARFHGGGRGPQGEIDQVLAVAGRPSLVGRGGPVAQMGFLRLAGGRTTLIVDAAVPPSGEASLLAHASTLAFELTSGRRPVVVSCGPGGEFGPRWRRAVRATASHSTLSLDSASSARVMPPLPGEGMGRLADGPRKVIVESASGSDGLKLDLAHDGWRGLCGLTHARMLRLSADGRSLDGEDVLTTLTTADRAALDRAMEAAEGLGLPFALRFHLHPDVQAEALPDGTVGIGLRSGEEWVLTVDGGEVSLEPSVYLERRRLHPRDTMQVVVGARVLGPLTRLRWTLAKASGTPEGLRDLNPGSDRDEEDE